MAFRVMFALPALAVSAGLLAAPVLGQSQLAQVQSQPLPPPAGATQAPPAAPPPAATPPQTPAPSTKAAPKTPAPTPLTKAAPKTAQAATCPEEKVDINAAPADTLKKLPQIGNQRSGAIIKARPYATPEDLLKKKVLKKAVYDKIKPCITASGVAAGATLTAKGAPPAAKAPAPATPVPLPAPTASEPAAKPQQ